MSDARVAEVEELFKKAEDCSRQGAAGDEKKIYDDIAGRCGTAPEPELKKLAAKALVNKGVILGKQRSDAEALACF